MAGIGDFAGGLMQGMEVKDQRRRQAAISDLLEQEYSQARNADVGAYEQFLNEGGDPENWIFMQEREDPFLVRQFYRIREKFGGRGAPEREDPYEDARERFSTQEGGMSPTRQAIPGQLVNYADGGKVEDDDDRAEIIGGAAGAGAAARRPIARAVAGAGRRALPIARTAGRAARSVGKVAGPVAAGVAVGEQLDEDYDERINRRFGFSGPTPEEGDPSIGGFAKFFGKRLLGYASDMGNVMTGGLAGRLYRDKQDDAPTQPTRTALPAPQVAAADAAVEDKATPDQVAAEAVDTAVEETPGHPDNPEQQWNFQQLAQEGMTPRDIPHVGVNDWRQYRQRHVLAALKRGQSVAEANAEVDEVQHQGFLRNFRQAAYLNMAGDTKGAALAARAAYQYFPNGSDIRFSAMQGPDGSEYLVGLGYNEETGEIVGEPQVMTPEYLNAMLANFENPQAFNAWKADQDEAFRLERQYEEVEKPQAQAELDLTRAQSEYYRSGAEKNRAAAAGGSGGGRSEANKLAADKAFRENVDLLSLEDKATAEQLAALMSRIYASGEGTTNEIIQFVNRLHEQGGEEAVLQWVAENTE